MKCFISAVALLLSLTALAAPAPMKTMNPKKSLKKDSSLNIDKPLSKIEEKPDAKKGKSAVGPNQVPMGSFPL